MYKQSAVLLLASCLTGGTPLRGARIASFQGLAFFPAAEGTSGAWGVSGDGRVVVGSAARRYPSGTSIEAFRWTETTGMVSLGGQSVREGIYYDSTAKAVSSDGGTIVGMTRSPAPPDPNRQPYRWSGGPEMIGLGHLPGPGNYGRAHAVSADGSVIVGLDRYVQPDPYVQGQFQAFRWEDTGDAEPNMVGLGFLEGNVQSMALGVSADGSLVVGASTSDRSLGAVGRWEAFVWSEATGMVGLGDFPGGDFESEAKGISDDGRVIVGYGETATGFEACRWVADDQGAWQMLTLGAIAGSDNIRAYASSADGSAIVGGYQTAPGFQAFVWEEETGLRDLRHELVNDCGLDLTGWTLRVATAVSDDGCVIVGLGTNPGGESQAWIATIPEPATLTLLALGGLALIRRRRR